MLNVLNIGDCFAAIAGTVDTFNICSHSRVAAYPESRNMGKDRFNLVLILVV